MGINRAVIGFSAICLLLGSCNSSETTTTGDSDPDSAALFAFMPGNTPVSQDVIDVVDVNPHPNVFEAALSVDEQDVMIDGTIVHSLIYKDLNNPGAYAGTPDGIPILQFVTEVGDEIVVTLTNNLASDCAAIACDTSIHWHGLELDNDSDGTGVTQNRLEPGETYTYRFKTFRPGIFWFHPHMKPGPQTFAGTYGVFIVRDPNEDTLVADGKIPPAPNTHTVVLSDIEFDVDGDVGYVDRSEGSSDQAVAWAELAEQCTVGMSDSCKAIANGEKVLVNGQNPGMAPPTISARSGAGVRLRLLNLSTNRYFRLKVSGNSDNKLYRIGGEGGFLEQVRLEGGTLGTWDTKYLQGEIVIPASGRSDVIIVPTGMDGNVITISGIDFPRGGPDPANPEDPGNDDSAGDLLHIVIDNSLEDVPFAIAAGNDVLGTGAIEDLKGLPVDPYLPTMDAMLGTGAGSSDAMMRLEGLGAGQTAIDGVQGHFEDSGDDYTMVPFQGATRYARVGDLLEVTITNVTNQHHPFHHHGFSFQPVKIIQHNDPDDPTDDDELYPFAYNEFVDVMDVYGGGGGSNLSIVIRLRAEDRQRITDNRQEMTAPAPNLYFDSGGGAGRWVLHCHLFLHAAVGMITELVILDTDSDGDGFATDEDCDDADPMVQHCNERPTADAGIDQVAECGELATLDGSGSSDPEADMLTYHWSAPGISFDDPASVTPSAQFPIGDTTVTLTVWDGEISDSDQVVVSVVDTTPPEISVALDPNRLWPPNHKMVAINASVNVTDACDTDPGFRLDYVTSDEPDNGKGDGNTVNDIQNVDIGTPDLQFDLRAERSGKGDGRTYTAGYTAFDASMNEASSMAIVEVPHNR